MRAVAKGGGEGNRCTRRGGGRGDGARARTMEYDSVKKSVAYGMSSIGSVNPIGLKGYRNTGQRRVQAPFGALPKQNRPDS